jgi:hypothetical protein
MLCPNCRAGCAADDIFCHSCGVDLSIPSRSLVPVQKQLPTVLNNGQLSRMAAGVGALAVGVGLELLRRGLLARLAQSAGQRLPTIPPHQLGELFTTGENKRTKLPKGYEIHETVVYMSRVIRREK